MSAWAVLFLPGLLAGAELWVRRASPRPECARKLVHATAGVACLALPAVIDSVATMAALAAVFTVLVAQAERRGLLTSLRVPRRSLGAELFPAAVLLAFALAGDRLWLYAAALLVLAVADTAAALVGTLAGRLEYRVWGERRTVEGSLAFFATCFPCLAVPLALADAGGALAALLAAVVCTVVEAVTPRGTDNVFLPVTVCAILPPLAALPPATLAPAALATGQLAAIGFALSRHAGRVGP